MEKEKTKPVKKSRSELRSEVGQDGIEKMERAIPAWEEQFVMPPVRPFVPGISPEISVFATVTIYGKKKSGKSVFVKWFMQAYKHMIPWAWTFTETQFNSSYESWIPKKFIIAQFDGGMLERIMLRQKAAIGLKHEDMPSFNARAWINWDDYSGKDIQYNEVLNRYYYTGRHFWTLNTFAAQTVKLTPPPIRANTDLAIIFNTDFQPNIETYWMDFAGKMDYKTFMQLFIENTREPHHFLAIDNNPNIPYTEKFYTGVAEVLDADIKYIFGCEDYWKDNVPQLIAIQKGVYKGIAQVTEDESHYQYPGSQPKKPQGPQFPSAWMPFKFPIECPDENRLEGKDREDQGVIGKKFNKDSGMSSRERGIRTRFEHRRQEAIRRVNNPNLNPAPQRPIQPREFHFHEHPRPRPH